MGITVIGFVGSVFSPYYFSAKNSIPNTDPMEHCAFNVAIYGTGKRIWAFTEYTSKHVSRNPNELVLGNNIINADKDGEILINVDEKSPIIGSKIKGTVRLSFSRLNTEKFCLDRNENHTWHPIAPRGEVVIDFPSLSVNFKGSGYHDMNYGNSPLEKDFVNWDWSRHTVKDKTIIFYDGVRTAQDNFSIAVGFDDKGKIEPIKPLPEIKKLPNTCLWRCPRSVRSDDEPRSIMTLENSPFYSRSLVRTKLLGSVAHGIHESLRLDIFKKNVVQHMLPFKLRRQK